MISSIDPGSAAYEGGVLPGDCLLSVNGHRIKDIFDYRYFTSEESVSLELQSPDGGIYILDIDKDPDEDLGIHFEIPMIEPDRGCANNCIFCFIDQLPGGLRDTLYFKDDDTRLSFLTGNYVTLTNISYRELERLVRYRLSPINVSVHTTDPELRCRMLRHKGAGDIMNKLEVLRKGCITVNAQIVLCPGYNDGEALKRTLTDLLSICDCVASVCIVPVGITRYREGLAPMRLPTKEEAADLIHTLERVQKEALPKAGTRFVYAADEFYIYAGLPIPSYEEYDEFPQLENGVGMLRLLDHEVCRYIASKGRRLKKALGEGFERTVDVATGMAAYSFLKNLIQYVMDSFPGLRVNVHAVKNDFFGETITVSGLLTGHDLIKGLAGQLGSDQLLITENMLRAGEDVFLDDLHVPDVEKALNIKITPVGSSGKNFVDSLLGLK